MWGKILAGVAVGVGAVAAAPFTGGGCSGLMISDTHLGENTRHIEVSDDQATSYFFG